VAWSSASHWVLGVPFDMVGRARRHGGQAQIDLEDITRVNVNRLLFITGVAGMWILGLVCFVLSTLAVAGFVYGSELAQAVFLLAFPMTLVGALSLRAAHVIRDTAAQGEVLCKRLVRLRIWTQGIGMASIFVTSLWGMYQNLALGPLYN
jgi:uncharacterized RDD family membrane protein YckC